MSQKTIWSAQRIKTFKSEPFDNQFLRTVALGNHGGSVIGECLVAASHIKDGDFHSWYQGWANIADQVQTQAERDERNGSNIAAAAGFLRASNYWRTAMTFLQARDPKRLPSSEQTQHCFRRFLLLSDYHWDEIHLEFGAVRMHGWIYSNAHDKTPRPTILALNGGDSTAEEQYFYLGAEAVKRGYTFLSIEGPAQNGVLARYPDEPFFPDYERVVSVMIDYALDRPEVDKTKLFLYGLSLGGYFGLRTAATDQRIQGLVANPPYLNFGAVQRAGMPGIIGKMSPKTLDKTVKLLAKLNPLIGYAWGVYQDIIGVSKPSQLFGRLDQFSIEDRVDDITCPVLCLIGESEGSEIKRQAKELMQRLPNKNNKLIIGTHDQGADAHCLTNNLALMQKHTFDWLETLL